MNPQIEALLDKLPDLDEREVEELRTLILEAAAELEDKPVTASSAATLNRLAEAADKLIAHESRGKIGALTASSGTVIRMARRRRPQASPERRTDAAGRAVLVAAGGLDGIRDGEPVTDRWALAEATARTLERMPRQGPPRGPVRLASVTTPYPEDRQLGEDTLENAKLIDAVCGPEALVASGGICQPVNVDYSVPTWATAERPLRDGLPAYQAPRGGIRFAKPPDLAEWAAATTVWTEAEDAAPEGTKPVVSLACPTEESVFVDAVPTRLGFGNLQARFSPEIVAAATDLAMTAAARIAENHLLDLIAASCVKDVTSATLIGATRDLLVAIDQVTAGYRQIHRLPDSQVMTVILPRWVKAQIRADLAREIGHAQNADWNSLAVTDEQIDELLLVHGVRALWHLDGQPAEGETYPSQVFASPEAKKPVKPFPAKMVWYCFPEGAVQFLDAGRLDLGVVRDSTLDATNDYETFVETFESIAFRGFTGGGLQLVSTLCASGATAGTVSTEGHCA